MSQRTLQLDGVNDFVNLELPRNYGDFKTAQDRKWCIYSMFRYNSGAHGFKIKRYVAAKQVLLYIDDVCVYDSFSESWIQRHPHLFSYWLKKTVIIEYLRRRDNA